MLSGCAGSQHHHYDAAPLPNHRLSPHSILPTIAANLMLSQTIRGPLAGQSRSCGTHVVRLAIILRRAGVCMRLRRARAWSPPPTRCRPLPTACGNCVPPTALKFACSPSPTPLVPKIPPPARGARGREKNNKPHSAASVLVLCPRARPRL